MIVLPDPVIVKIASNMGLKKAGREYQTHSKIHSPKHCQVICREGELCVSWNYDLSTKTCHLYQTVDERIGFIGKNYVFWTEGMWKIKLSLQTSCFDRKTISYSESSVLKSAKKFVKPMQNVFFWSWNYESQICYRKNGNDLRHLRGKQNYISGPRVCENCFRKGVNLESKDIETINKTSSPRDCQIHCQKLRDCKLWVLIGRVCYLRTERISHIHIETDAVSGTPECSFVLDYHNSISGEGKITQGILYTKTCVRKMPDFHRSYKRDYRTLYISGPKFCGLRTLMEHNNVSYEGKISGPKHCQDCFVRDVAYLPLLNKTIDHALSPYDCQRFLKERSAVQVNVYTVSTKNKISEISPDFIKNRQNEHDIIRFKTPESQLYEVKNKGNEFYQRNKWNVQEHGITNFSSSNKSNQHKVESLLNEFNLKDDTEILLVDENGKVENITGGDQINDWDNACLIVGIEIDVPNHDIYSSLTNPFECAVFCKLHSECYSWTFKFGKKVCQIKGIFTSFDVKEEKDSVSGIASCDLI
ncbi:unnamed protein product [Lepeophtheirus salmonis]|uniref:(salmon louse) hypothetical protein n=1 Tax=Lepeophtheirus salmonis TaxID=72036 RepID=A0A7R8H3D9_LEPSM|nr:unnamed protein product [Lepeophtheirus salmonis]CAF2842631.1 unnamed protein product [Lepeophtheirus salmonis]